MHYVNAGAMVDGTRPKTKKALRVALAECPGAVQFDVTDLFYDGPRPLVASALPPHLSVSVCGPDPYTARRWYGQVTAGENGPELA
jgi:hypothetical protein